MCKTSFPSVLPPFDSRWMWRQYQIQIITAQNWRQLLNARPFRPFRVLLSDGSQHDIPRHEFGWVAGNRLFVGVPATSNNPEELSVDQLSILHISRIEELSGSKAA